MNKGEVKRLCVNCAFWDEHKNSKGEGQGTGDCHLAPPTVDPDLYYGQWPVTAENAWCGLHRFEMVIKTGKDE